ncbi:ATP-dependent RNA helicase DHX58-like isoform X2 [Dreissena polymorpha]|uniref:ATP-dependent RNA helicase DHX58-like isoform X2 n=1 Tax=Dreissena polymorpha TaxID=45954 RepID=UPI002264E91E|nr:ATP-dependent RNA helicase DHX58-like isoform X2 [Dreissena polymorpha]
MATKRPPPVGSEHYDEESHIQWMLEACFEYIVKSLDWRDLLAYPYFKTDDIRKFKDVYKNGGSTDATRKMLLHIQQLKQPDRFSRLVAEVEDSENSKVLTILKAEQFPIMFESNSKEVLKKNLQFIGAYVELIEILPVLVACKLISDREAKDIRTTCNSTSSFKAALDLMLLVTNKEEYWLPKFLLFLIVHSGEYSYIANKIDPHLTEALEKEDIFLPGWSVEGFIAQYRGDLSSLRTINPFHSTSSGEVDDENWEGEEIEFKLRKYQQELAAPAIEGKNVVIVAPTGSGKTRVAYKIIQEHIQRLQGHGVPKVVFLVNQVALANQQGKECKKLLPMYKCHTITGDAQRNKREYLNDFMDKRDILVVTAQVLFDALVRKEIESISRFSLIIFDECHLTQANHPYNQIMGLYLELKFSKQQVDLPQIVGLTASAGVGKARDVGKAVDHIKRLMANIDAHLISTVISNIGELREYVSMPDEETTTVARRANDVFGKAVIKLMTILERRMANSTVVTGMAEFVKKEKELKAPAEKGNAAYTQWVSKLRNETAKLKDDKARKFLQPCRSHLKYYNNALIIYNDARVEDALRYLEQKMARWKKKALNMDLNEKLIYEAYKKLKKVPLDTSSENPKLEMFREMIMSSYSRSDIENSRGIVFVKTRELAHAIISWMKDTPGLRELNPTHFVGQDTIISSFKGFMTKAKQDDALKYFREGKHKLIVATSVDEDRLNITKCNLVIRYDHVTNEISKIQSRGRDRAADSKYVVIAEKKNKNGREGGIEHDQRGHDAACHHSTAGIHRKQSGQISRGIIKASRGGHSGKETEPSRKKASYDESWTVRSVMLSMRSVYLHVRQREENPRCPPCCCRRILDRTSDLQR